MSEITKAAKRAAESVQDWAETTVCIMSSRAEGIDHQAKLILAEFAPLLAAKDAKSLTCCFCNAPCDSLAALKEHSAGCTEHPAVSPEAAELRRDAERWRFLRAHSLTWTGSKTHQRCIKYSPTINKSLPEFVDAAIDAAIAVQPAREGGGA